MPQGPAPTAPTHTSQAGGPPQVPPVNNQNTECQDLLECNANTNGSTRVPADGKGPGPTKGKNKTSEPCPGTSSGTSSTTQPAGHTILCSACSTSGHWSRNCPYYNFCDICRVTTHSTHMSRAAKHGNTTAGSPVCIYCGKTNHGLAYCRYRPRDNCEEPRNTPDALKTGTVGENSAPVARNQTGSTPHNNNKVPFSHSEGRGQSQPNGGQHRSQHREQTGAAPRGQKLKDLKQLPGQPISSYMYKYGRIHFLATGNQAQNERYPTAIMEFIESLNPKIMRALAKKHADPRTRPQTLQQAFDMAEEASRRILETESFERSSTVQFSGSVNNIYKSESEVNEVL